MGLLGLHVILLFLPPIPPDLRAIMPPGGSLWSYLIGYTAVVLLLAELRRRSPTTIESWRQIRPGRRRLIATIAVAGTLAGAVALRAGAPGRFARFSGEEGLWEVLTLFCYLAAAALLWHVAQSHSAREERRPVQLLAGIYLLLALEEIDYFGIFGAFFGRIGGVYAGTLHDIIRLVAEGVLTASGAIALLAIALLVLGVLWRTSFLSPNWLWRVIRTPEFPWVILGLGFLSVAAIQDGALFGWLPVQPSLEEALELVGAMCLLVFALDICVRESDRAANDDASPADKSSRTAADATATAY